MLKDAGYQQFDPKKTYKPGDKIYFVQCNKAVVASTIGTKSFEEMCIRDRIWVPPERWHR